MSEDKNPKEDGYVRVIDPKEKMWRGVKNITKGMNPTERANFLIELVESLTKDNSNTENIN